VRTARAHVCRRGAAYGLSGVVKGLGLMSMKNAGIMDALKAAVEDKKDAGAREVCVVCACVCVCVCVWGALVGSCQRYGLQHV
jgi:tetrahydromethanopterin S-methyltransferase subunit C